jgi:hypothetical protein
MNLTKDGEIKLGFESFTQQKTQFQHTFLYSGEGDGGGGGGGPCGFAQIGNPMQRMNLSTTTTMPPLLSNHPKSHY